MSEHVSDYAEHYEAMLDDDLLRVAAHFDNLVPNAREALQSEMGRRGLVARIEHARTPSITQEEKGLTGSGIFPRFMRNLLIFGVCGIAEIVVLVWLLSRTSGVDITRSVADLTQACIYLSLLLAFLTSKFFVPQRIRTLWIVAIVSPPVTLAIVVCLMILHVKSSAITKAVWLLVIAWIAYGWWRDRRGKAKAN